MWSGSYIWTTQSPSLTLKLDFHISRECIWMTPKLHWDQEKIDMKTLDCTYHIPIIWVLSFSALVFYYFSGHLGISAFRHIVSDLRTQNIPLILETPMFDATEIWRKEISTLNNLSKLVDDSWIPQTESSLMNELASLVRRAAIKPTEASETCPRKWDTKEGEEVCNFECT